jgi:hypothetical protein
MPEDSVHSAGRLVGYALNVFPYETFAELLACLEGPILKIKERIFPQEIFPIELRFSERLVNELLQDCDRVARLKYFLDTHDLALVTVNAFVMPPFHGERVKERVYLPAWHVVRGRGHRRDACATLRQRSIRRAQAGHNESRGRQHPQGR